MTRISRRLAAAAALCALVLAAGCSQDETGRGAGPAPSSAAAPEQAGRFASPNPGSVNTYWISAPQGLILVDTLRTLTDARNAVEEVRRTGRPVVAILLTHSHPDHVGGAGVFHDAFPQAPMYASQETLRIMRADRLGFYALTRSLPNADYPAELTYPDQTFVDGAALHVGGLTLETAGFAAAESESATAYYRPDTGELFSGDLVGNRVTPALLEGHSCGWLQALARLRERFPAARTVYPGHGAPGPAGPMMDETREYLAHLRGLTRPAVVADSPEGAAVSADERKSIIAEMDRAYPGYPTVASLPTMMEENVKGVAGELAAEDPARNPAACA